MLTSARCSSMCYSLKAVGALRGVCESLPWAGLSESGAHICLAGVLSGNWDPCFLPPAVEPRSHCHLALDDAGGTFAPWEVWLTQKPLGPSVPTLRNWCSVARGSPLGFAWLWFSCVCTLLSVCVCILCVFTSMQISVCWGQRSVSSVFFSHFLSLKTYMFIYEPECLPACMVYAPCAFLVPVEATWSYR